MVETREDLHKQVRMLTNITFKSTEVQFVMADLCFSDIRINFLKD
jgi:hypothetical protein